MADRAFLDTNVLVYLFDAADPGRRRAAQRVVHAEVSAGRAVVGTQVLREFYAVVTRKLAHPLSAADAESHVRRFARLPTVADDADLVLGAIALHQRESLSFWDALIVEAARRGGCARLLSEDLQHGRTIGGVTVTNPFLA